MRADERIEQGGTLLRVMLYGHQKTKKTWWALKAAESNFNVILLDGDDGWQIVNQIKPEAQKRIQIVDLVDKMNTSVFAKFMERLLKKQFVDWDEDEKTFIGLNPVANAMTLDSRSLTPQDVVVLDSWTALVWSWTLQYAKENKQEVDSADWIDRDFYAWSGRKALSTAQRLKSFPCHVIVIGHQTTFEKRAKSKTTGKEEIVSTREQMISTSNPVGSRMGAMFSDALRFERINSSVTKVIAEGDANHEGGSRIVKPGSYNWEDLQFVDIAKAANVKIPDESNPYIDFSIQERTSSIKLDSEKPVVENAKSESEPAEKKVKITLGKK